MIPPVIAIIQEWPWFCDALLYFACVAVAYVIVERIVEWADRP